jgi:hypothetical protein
MSEQAAVATAPTRSATRRAVSNHPNASVALGSGAGLGPIVIWLIGVAHVQMTPEVGGAIGGLVAAGFLLVGRRGIKPVIVGLWKGPE